MAQEGEAADEFSSVNPTYVLTNLDAGTRYTFNVQAVGALDRLSERSSGTVTQQTLTEPPRRFVVTSTRSTSISLRWRTAVGKFSSFYFVIAIDVSITAKMGRPDFLGWD